MRRLLGIAILIVLSALMIGLLIEPFLPVSPIVQQASIGLVLTVYGAVLMFGVPMVQQAIRRRRSTRKLPLGDHRRRLD
jgi:predicted MFS family arabinose efflux permease